LLALAAAVLDSFAILLAGLLLFGSATASGLQARYASAGSRTGSVASWSASSGSEPSRSAWRRCS